ncbi:MAG TPA: DUF445 domain-containing protein [Bacteroidia bacterium]|jgi:uncharacterized membrane-anchored protein YjiN (DUF445 family)|nr:DUF445 domain-containing protein [Bacteroidia bacterium]
MLKKNRIGLVSLLAAVCGLIITYTLIRLGVLKSPGWGILQAGFEAATIGGMADWFAVTALFREIPIPIPFIRRHTNIIANNREKITDGAVDLITNKWLTPEVIKEKITDISIAESILKSLDEPQNRLRAIDFLRDILNRLVDNLDKPEVASLLQKILKDQIAGVDLATPLGHWLEKSIKGGDHNQLWDMILDSAGKTINDPSTRRILLEKIREKAEEYKSEGWLKRLALGVAETVGAFDQNSIVSKMIGSINEFIKEAKGNPNHPVRQRFDKSLLEFAHNLTIGEPGAHNIVNDLKRKLIENADARQVIQGILIRFKATVKEELKSNDTTFMILLTKYFDGAIAELNGDKIAQQKIDTWLKETIVTLVIKYHPEIGNMIRQSITKLNDTELVSQIENQVGNDLQYIRFNGAVVGGFVGVVLTIIKLLIQ